MIATLTFKFGRIPGAPQTSLTVGAVTVFVGPNNSGKSKVLREIEQYCRSGQKDATAVILEHMTFTGLTAPAAAATVDSMKQGPSPGEALQVGMQYIGSRMGRLQVNLQGLLQVIEDPNANPGAFCQWFLNLNTLRLDGQGRMALVGSQTAGDLQQPSHLSLQILFLNNAKRYEVRRIVFEAFDRYFVVDPTHLGQFRIRLSDSPPASDMQERGIHADAVEFQGKAQLIDQASDGVKAFTGIITELMAGDPRILLIDEPEAFLHPSLASKLGIEVSRAAVGADKRVFVSTHSPTFVMGCVHSGAPVNIVRLTYRAGNATARLLPSTEILELMRNPLLRSTGVLSGLFYEFVVVTESDADRAFYEEINERLLRLKPSWGISNCLFLNAQNKQTVPTLIRPLRQLGIPAAGIVDIDVLKEGGTAWAKLLSASNVPALATNSLATLRASVLQAMIKTGKDMKRDGGVAILEGQEQEAAVHLLAQLAEYGIFVVPGGELESWLKKLASPGHGPAWLIDIFQKMGEDPTSPAYAKPSEADVWMFLSKVNKWLTNPDRFGIPA
ncbi:MAG: ATPase [Gammaproteobacteria bacterium]|nr:ATPase [Gammaproteobacteria bacterium]